MHRSFSPVHDASVLSDELRRPPPADDTTSAVIRRIEPRDVVDYIDLIQRIDLESRFLAWEPGERELDVDLLRARVGRADASTGVHLIATHEDRPVGFLVGHRPPMRRLRHRADFTMAVLQRFHRRGVGIRLLEALHAWAASANIERVELTVMAHNHAAIALYRRAGYEHEGLKRGSLRVDGHSVDEVLMARAIDQTIEAESRPPGPTEPLDRSSESAHITPGRTAPSRA